MGRLEIARALEEGAEVEIVVAQIGACLRDVGLGVEHHAARDRATRHDNPERGNDGFAIVDLDPPRQRLDRQIGRRDHPPRVQGHVHIHHSQLLDLERDIRKEFSAHLELGLGLFLLCRHHAAIRRRADERRQIGEIEMGGNEIGLEEGALRPLVD